MLSLWHCANHCRRSAGIDQEHGAHIGITFVQARLLTREDIYRHNEFYACRPRCLSHAAMTPIQPIGYRARPCRGFEGPENSHTFFLSFARASRLANTCSHLCKQSRLRICPFHAEHAHLHRVHLSLLPSTCVHRRPTPLFGDDSSRTHTKRARRRRLHYVYTHKHKPLI